MATSAAAVTSSSKKVALISVGPGGCGKDFLLPHLKEKYPTLLKVPFADPNTFLDKDDDTAGLNKSHNHFFTIASENVARKGDTRDITMDAKSMAELCKNHTIVVVLIQWKGNSGLTDKQFVSFLNIADVLILWDNNGGLPNTHKNRLMVTPQFVKEKTHKDIFSQATTIPTAHSTS